MFAGDPTLPVNDTRMYWSEFTDSYICTNPKAGSSLWRERAGKLMRDTRGHSWAIPLTVDTNHHGYNYTGIFFAPRTF